MIGSSQTALQSNAAEPLVPAPASVEPCRRPAELFYAVDETSPPLCLILIGLQYSVMTAIYLIIVAIILRHARLPAADSVRVMGIATR